MTDVPIFKFLDSAAIRIGPNELHINDPSIYHVIYSQQHSFLKDAVFYAGFNAPHTAFTEEDPILHRQRRKLINPQFSKQGIASMQSLIDSKVDYMLQAISKFESRGAVHMHNAFRYALNWAVLLPPSRGSDIPQI